jgi:hypothetical protein
VRDVVAVRFAHFDDFARVHRRLARSGSALPPTFGLGATSPMIGDLGFVRVVDDRTR